MPPECTEDLTYSCAETKKQVHSSRLELLNKPLENTDVEWFIDGSSYVKEEVRKADYSIVNLNQVTEAQTMPSNTSTQKAECIALIRKRPPSLYTHTQTHTYHTYIHAASKYASLMLHAHAAIWRERGLLTAKNSPIMHVKEILALLQAVLEPLDAAVSRGH